jgi:ParB family chromosome partitioning protein
MENKRKALGRGLEQLFNNENLDLETIEKTIYETTKPEDIKNIDLEMLRPNPYQPRKVFSEDSLLELSESIKEHGVFQPIIVKKSINGYEIIAGERRVRASRMAGKETIPAIIRDFSDEDMMQIALLENLQREDLNAIEEATAYKMMIDRLSLTQEELAKKLGKSRSHITNMLGILRLPEEIKDLVISGKLSMSHARFLSKETDIVAMKKMALEIVNKAMPVHELEKSGKKTSSFNKKKENNSKYLYVQEILREKLDSRVTIRDKKIEITFVNDADLNRILDILDVKE